MSRHSMIYNQLICVSWQFINFIKLNSVSKYSTEVEYQSMSSACSKHYLALQAPYRAGFPQPPPILLHADNTNTITITINAIFHKCTEKIFILTILLSLVSYALKSPAYHSRYLAFYVSLPYPWYVPIVSLQYVGITAS